MIISGAIARAGIIVVFVLLHDLTKKSHSPLIKCQMQALAPGVYLLRRIFTQ